jgi:uncharacterized membrane protein
MSPTRARTLALCCVAALLLLHLVWQFGVSSASLSARALGAVTFGLPLAAVLIGWRRAPRKAALYGAVLSLFCLAHGVLLLMEQPAQPLLGALELGLVLALNTVLSFGMRAEREAARAAQPDRSHG